MDLAKSLGVPQPPEVSQTLLEPLLLPFREVDVSVEDGKRLLEAEARQP